MISSHCGRSARNTCRTASQRCRASPAIRSGTISAPQSLPAGRSVSGFTTDYGLTAIDVAKICFLSGLTFWLGNLFVLGLGLTLAPMLPPARWICCQPTINRLIALGCLAGIGVLFRMAGHGQGTPRTWARHGWKVVLPSARLTLLQMLIGVVDLGFCAHRDVSPDPDATPQIDFISLAVVFILATLLGFASHAPGSLGVFDAAMLVALPEFGREQLLATLAGVPGAVFPDPVQRLDQHHGRARALAQRGTALAATPPAERSLRRGGRSHGDRGATAGEAAGAGLNGRLSITNKLPSQAWRL